MGQIFTLAQLNRSIRGLSVSGLNVFLMTLPQTIIFGSIVFYGLGPEWISLGILCSIIGHISACMAVLFFADNKGIVVAPSAYSTIIFSAVIADYVSENNYGATEFDLKIHAITIAFLIGSLSGLVQYIFFKLKLIRIIQFIPFEVVTGIVTVTGFMIIIMQLPIMMGIFLTAEAASFSYYFNQISYQNLIIGLITILFMALLPVMFLGIPRALWALLLSSVFTNLFIQLGVAKNINFLPNIEPSQFFDLLHIMYDKAPSLSSNAVIYSSLLIAVMSLATLNSISLLIASRQLVLKSVNEKDGSRDLLANSISNMITPIFGGLPSTGRIGDTVLASKQKTSGRNITITTVSFYMILLIFSNIIFHRIPISALAAISMVIAYDLIDVKFQTLPKALISKNTHFLKQNTFFCSMILSMLFTSLTFNILFAILVGIIFVTLDFIINVAKFNILIEKLNTFRARVKRPEDHDVLINSELTHGILVSLTGYLTFFVAETLKVKLNRSSDEKKRYLFFDLRKVNFADATGSNMLSTFIKNAANEKQKISVIYSHKQNKLIDFLKGNFDSTNLKNKIHFYEDLNFALETVENEIVASLSNSKPHCHEVDNELFFGLDKSETTSVLELMERQSFKDGEVINRNFDQYPLYVIIRGKVHVYIENTAEKVINKDIKLHTYLAGSVLGEISFLDHKFPSAQMITSEACQVLKLTREKYELIKSKSPKLALKIAENLALIIADKVRRTNIAISKEIR